MSDIYWNGDFAYNMATVTSNKELSQALLRRLITPPGDVRETYDGSLLNSPDYGINLPGLINAAIDSTSPIVIAQRIQNQMESDERVDSASVTVTSTGLSQMSFLIGITPADPVEGAFELEISVDNVTVDLLRSTA